MRTYQALPAAFQHSPRTGTLLLTSSQWVTLYFIWLKQPQQPRISRLRGDATIHLAIGGLQRFLSS